MSITAGRKGKFFNIKTKQNKIKWPGYIEDGGTATPASGSATQYGVTSPTTLPFSEEASRTLYLASLTLTNLHFRLCIYCEALALNSSSYRPATLHNHHFQSTAMLEVRAGQLQPTGGPHNSYGLCAVLKVMSYSL